MPESLRELVPGGSQRLMRRFRTDQPPSSPGGAARVALSAGVIDQGAYIQFETDLHLYGLWEALLYAENYEHKGMYQPGTAANAAKAAMARLPEYKDPSS